MSARERGAERRRGVFVAIAAVLILATQLGFGAGAATGPTTRPATRPPTTDAEVLPLAVQVASVQPTILTPATVVTVTGTIASSGATVDHLHIALRIRGLSTRGDLASLRASQNTDGYALATGSEQAGGPHRTINGAHVQHFRVTFAADDALRVTGTTNFAAALIIAVRGTVAANGTDASATAEQGHTVLAVPVVPSTPQAPPILSFVIPVTAPPTNPLGDAPLPATDTVGRIEVQLDGIVAGATEAGDAAPWLTLAVDPALVEQLCAAAGCDAHAALPNVPKSLAAHARNALTLLRRAATTTGTGIQLTALPYADADIDALIRAGQSDRVDELMRDAGTEIHDLLGVPAPRVDPALPPDGVVTRAAVDQLISLGTGTAIVSDATLPVAPDAESNVATATASSDLTGSRGLTLPTLVTDAQLEDLVTSADGGAPALAAPSAEALLAETAAITAERPNADQRALVVLAPRFWNATRAYVHAVTLGLGVAPWLDHDTLAHATALPGVARTQTLVSSANGEVPATTINEIAQLRDDVAAATELPSGPTKAATERLQAQVRQPLLAALARASSAWWRADPAQASALTDAVHAQTQKILHGITIAVASSVLVTGSSGKVPVQLENTLGFAVGVRVELSDLSGRLEPFSHVFPLPAATQGSSGKAQEELTVTSRSAGRFAAQLQLATPSGVLLGDAQAFQVRSQNYGTLAVGITAGALFLLVVALVVRTVRALRRRRGQRIAAAAL